jgi:hypothetical protein
MQEWSWPGLKDNYIHRHMSQLMPVWPFREISPEGTPALFKAASIVLAKKDSYHESAGHGILHGALIAANLKNAKSVNRRLLQLTSEDYYYNSLASSHNDKHGVFCTDTCNAVPAIMMEMLVCSSPDTLELLPALPQSLTQGSISGVKGRNRLTVQDLSWDTEKGSVNCTLKSDIDQDITLIDRDGIESVKVSVPKGGSTPSFQALPDTALSESPLGKIARIIHLRAGMSTVINISSGHLRKSSQELS